ncbi:MAG: cupin domain-containing protein [Anaerolineae bacterium]
MHHVGKFDPTNFRPLAGYERHSQGYRRVALVDHTVGSVHSGVGICELAPGGSLDAHVHSYEEGFFLLEGQAILGLNGHACELGPNDYGVVQVATSHSWRNAGSTPVRWLEMLAPQPPAQHAFRFWQDWEGYLAEKLEQQM